MGGDKQTVGTELVDIGRALRQLAGDVDLLQEIVEIFLDMVPDRLAELERLIAAGDAAEVANQAHEIKGSAATFCAARLAEAASALEVSARSGSLADAQSFLARIRDEFQQLRDRLSALDWQTIATFPGC
jgi:HPt (histidine-containing phosphotransfer) domain-containing protein